ncbi:MAG: hypothetical protein EOP83_35730 [Verrucomicrobiaceae bacterium]|nr:MAG: hypothetical protein EOP83_35730 [Verrucomicrobiaceae bacterium]
MKLEQDVQTAPGVERIVIERWIPNTIYEVWVHDFTGTGVGLLSGSLELAIVIAGTRTVLKPTKRGYSARAWHAASIFPDHGGLQKVDGLMEKFEIPGLGVMQ